MEEEATLTLSSDIERILNDWWFHLFGINVKAIIKKNTLSKTLFKNKLKNN